ncbi:TIGR03792 family protein [Okeanomitos corallinicola TIOX110]|uniref:TIGR03792 family protein n=1 Tax=Okeanomitos corallinicola TIOX110 TaxID=3133117 RepID=A0ABZ2UQ76_9CYAN
MVIELLKFKVPGELRETFIQKDEEIWSSALSKYPGFLGKEVWINPDDFTEVLIVVRWQNRELWKAIPEEKINAVSQEFDNSLGFEYQMLAVSEYQVRKYSQI